MISSLPLWTFFSTTVYGGKREHYSISGTPLWPNSYNSSLTFLLILPISLRVLIRCLLSAYLVYLHCLSLNIYFPHSYYWYHSQLVLTSFLHILTNSLRLQILLILLLFSCLVSYSCYLYQFLRLIPLSLALSLYCDLFFLLSYSSNNLFSFLAIIVGLVPLIAPPAIIVGLVPLIPPLAFLVGLIPWISPPAFIAGLVPLISGPGLGP